MADQKPNGWWKRFDIVRFLGSFGLRTLSMKLFAGMLVMTALAILLVCVIAYWSFSSTIESGEQLQGVARAAAEASDLFLSENIKFAKSIASDDAIVAASEHAAREAERIGVTAPVISTDLINRLEEQYKTTRIIKRDAAIDELLRDKQRERGVIERMFFTDKYGLNAGMAQMTEDFVQSDEMWWREAMRTGVYIEDVTYDKPSDSFAVQICVAIPSKGDGYNG